MQVYRYERIKKLQSMYSDYLAYLDTCQNPWQNALEAADELALQLEKLWGINIEEEEAVNDCLH